MRFTWSRRGRLPRLYGGLRPRFLDPGAVVAQGAEHSLDDVWRIEARLVVLLVGRLVLLEQVGQPHRADLEAGVGQALVAGHRQHMRAEAADAGFLDRHYDLVRGDQLADQLGIERLDETQVGNGGREALGLEL